MYLSWKRMSDMKAIKGNYIWWAAVQLAAGILFTILWIFWKVEFLTILAICLPSLAVFNIWFYHDRVDDEREKYLLLKVFSRSASFTLVFLTYIFVGGKVDANFFLYVLWSIALVLRGVFGLFYFIRE